MILNIYLVKRRRAIGAEVVAQFEGVLTDQRFSFFFTEATHR